MSPLKIMKVLIVDDNPAIHADFAKILTTAAPAAGLDELERLSFGDVPDTTERPSIRDREHHGASQPEIPAA